MPNVFETNSEDLEGGYQPPIGPSPDPWEEPIYIVGMYRGTDLRHGFVRNRRYYLRISKHEVINRDGVGHVTYNSLESFFKDWIVSGAH